MNFAQTHIFNQLLQGTPFSSSELIDLIKTAPNRYKEHYIIKRNNRGKRLISQPTRELKYVQKYFIQNILNKLPIHSAAKAYRTGLSIRDHALPHANSRYLLKMDFKDFFPSITAEGLCYRLKIDFGFSDSDLYIIKRIICKRDPSTGVLKLSIGSPSSPYISNYFLFEFDEIVTSFCLENDVVYTRYADDLAFSTNLPKKLDIVELYIRNLIQDLSYLGLELNDKKTVNVSKKNKRMLVGLTLSNEGRVSVGRGKKRDLRSQLYRASKGEMESEELQKLKGQLAFLWSVDPIFVQNLCKRYSARKISELDFNK